MKLYNTKNLFETVDFKTASLRGLASDQGLFMPESFPYFEKEFFNNSRGYSLQKISSKVAYALFGDELPHSIIDKIIKEAINFPIPLKRLSNNVFILELYHGPTLAFKDVGARFLARIIGHFHKATSKKIYVLVATSGDTGSAVGSGFLDIDGICVILLYPSGGVSAIQEKQLTTLGHNVYALEVKGSFDDCQQLVKQVFNDSMFNNSFLLTSANSINIARLLPQTFYFFWAYIQLISIVKDTKDFVFSVPCGNLGNLTAGVIAKKMGLPVPRFIAAFNANDVFPHYLSSGKFVSKPTIQTISNAMDVGNPNNFSRLQNLYPTLTNMRRDIWSASISDEETRIVMKNTFLHTSRILDPHTAVGLASYKKYCKSINKTPLGIILGTAHPAKFSNIVIETTGKSVDLPESLQLAMKSPKKATKISNSSKDVKSFIESLEQ